MAIDLKGRVLARLLRWGVRLSQRAGNSDLATQFQTVADSFLPALPREAYARAKELWQAAQTAAAKRLLNDLLAADPTHPEANNLLGVIFLETGEEELAGSYFCRALDSRPSYAAANNNLGSVHLARLELDLAARCYVAALASDPGYVQALTNLGTVLNMQGKYQEAERNCLRAVELAPDFAGARCNLGNSLLSLGRVGEAVAEYREALRLVPDLPEALANLALALEDTTYLVGTIDYYEKQLVRQPGNYLPYLRIAQALQALHRWDEAHDRLIEALEIQPKAVDVLMLLAINYGFVGDMRTAIDYLRRVLKIGPNESASSGIVFDSLYLENVSGEDLCRGYRLWAECYGLRPQLPIQSAELAIAGRKLRLGYVSRDFGRHSVAYFLEPILTHHDRTVFDIYCYSTLMQGDDFTDRFKNSANVWRDISMLSETSAADLILRDGVDILIDLSGHTTGNRLGVFASRPAPVQITYLGHPTTTGLSTIDYRLGDTLTDPPGAADSHYTEKLWRLPGCFLAYRPPDDAPSVAPPPALVNGYITFGSFNNVSKLNDAVVAAWADILNAVAGSRLIIKNFALSSERGRARIQRGFERRGIDLTRIELAGWRPDVKNHLELYGAVDIALDPFPYNGTTTTCEALWMGVPVVCLEGARHSARVGLSLLTSVGLQDLVGKNLAEYHRCAVDLAGDLSQLVDLRAGMRDRMLGSALLDQKGFTQRLEFAYCEMWQHYCIARSADRTGNEGLSKSTVNNTTVTLSFAGGKICVPASLNVLTRYVLEEQGDWFEDEIRFTRKLLAAGNRAIDVGANYGVYTVSMASIVGDTGRVWAMEPSPSTASMLKQTLSANALKNVTLIECAVSDYSGACDFSTGEGAEFAHMVSEDDRRDLDADAESCISVAVKTLDELAVMYGWRQIDFLKIDAEGQEPQVVRGGARFLVDASPLVMAEYKHGSSVNISLIDEFEAHGFRSYRLNSALMVLVPHTPSNTDAFLLNLFFCRDDRASALAARDLLIPHGQTEDIGEGPKSLEACIQLYRYATDVHKPLKARVCALFEAGSSAAGLVTSRQSLADRISAATILSGAGARAAACSAFEQIFNELRNDTELDGAPDLNPDFSWRDDLDQERMRRQVTAGIAGWLVRNLAYSSFFAPVQTLRYLAIMREYGYQADEATRQIEMINRRRAQIALNMLTND